MRNRTKSALLTLFLTILLGVVLGCQQGNTSGGEIDHQSGQADSSSIGSVALELPDGEELQTGDMMGFRVYAKDRNDAPITDIRVTCDTEKGLALIEPTSGHETTDSNGQISGKVGCDNAGSYLLACRLQSSSRRDTVTVKCVGDRPAGFSGFAGAGGGTLGGGNSDNTTNSGARISSITAYDTGDFSTATTSIDIAQDVCTTNGTATPEPFYDSGVKFTVVNDTPYLLLLKSYKYTVSNAFGTGTSFTSSTIKFTSSASAAADANGGTGTVQALFLDASSGGKRYVGSNQNIPLTATGFKNITFTITADNELGEEMEIKGSEALSFDDFGRCS